MNSWRPSRELWLLLAITALGAFLRFFRLATLPPGDGFDVAQYGVDALQILGGARPIFLETNFGREALYSYLVAGVYALSGPSTLGIRVVSALLGTLTIPANYLVARELVPDRRDMLRYLPLLVALLTALSYWHLNWSRMGLRVILVPLVASLLFTFLWRGFRRERWTDFAVAGLLLGLGFYTYQAARLLPVLVAVAFALVALSRRRWTRQDTAQALLVAGLALLVYLPLGVYAAQNPGALTTRIEQAALLDTTQPLGPQLVVLADQTLAALAMYGVRGDMDPLFTIPGRPSLNPFLFAFLLVGIVLALWRIRQPSYPFLLAWLMVMTAPAMVADLAATAKRALGAFPAAMVLVALGMLLPWAWLRLRSERRAVAGAYALLLAGGLAFTAWSTYRDYFVVWAADPDLPIHFQVDHAEIGRAIAALPADERVYLSPYPPDQPVIQLHAGLRPDIRGYNGRHCVVYPDPVAGEQAAAYIVVPGLQDASLAFLREMYPSGEFTEGPLRPNSDRPYYQMLHVPAGAQPTGQPAVATGISWAGQIELLGYDLSATSVAPGETITLHLTYRPLSGSLPDYTAFVHLLGPTNPQTGSPLWAQVDSRPCQGAAPTSQWQPGELVRDTVQLTLPADAPVGEYQLVTGFYTWPDLVRLSVDGTEESAAPLATITVRPPD